MKNYSNVSTAFLQLFSLLTVVLGAAFLFSGSSCNTSKSRDSKTAACELNEAKFDKEEDKKNAILLVDAAEMHLTEIHLAQLAQQEAKHIDVKELGKMMERINSNALNNLTKIAGKKSIAIPVSATEQGLQAAEFLNKKKGHAFDKEYCDMMVVSQKRTIKMLEQIVDESEDAEIKIWAFCALPSLRKHLQYAEICQKKYAEYN
jgi:putative membrane protein